MAKMTRKINNTNILQDMEALCEKMASQNQETVVMSVNKAKNSVYCHGSRLGRKFLLSDNEVCQRFVKFCADVFNAGATREDLQNGDFVIPVKTIDEILHPVVIDTQQNSIFGSKSTTSTNTIDENEIGKAEDNETNLKTESQTKIRIGTYVDLNPADDLDLDLTAQSPSVKSVLQTEDDVEDDSDIVEEYSSGNEVYVSKKNDQSVKDFSCDICSKRLGSKASLQRHKLLHREKSKSCDVCGKKFYRSDDVAKHMKVHQSEADRDKGKKSCCVCGRNFQRATSLKLHMKSAHKTDDSKVKGQSKPKLQYVCTVCNVDFRNKFGLDRHMKCHENIKIFKCYVCNESFRTDKQLQTHVANHQVMLMFKCVLCGDVFQSDPELKEHQSKSCAKIRKESLNIDTFSNGGHGDVNNSANSFLKQSPDTITEQHVPKTKDKQDSGFCDLDLEETNKMSPSSKTDSISKSLTEVTDDRAKSQTNAGVPSSHNPKGHTCDICNRCFKQPLALYKHRLYHDNFGMFACRFCDYVTKSKVNLNRHSKRHLDIKPHTCDVCSKGFTEKHNLSLHMLSHTKERPHLCDTCGKGFRTAQLLKRHKRVHTGERPYVCKQCGKSFMTADVLRNHENIHSNYRGYICDVCGMSFNQKCSLYTHKHKHSDKPSHICTECGKGCRSAASLKIHFVSKHLKVEDVGSYGLKVYECEKCHKLFADKSDLNIHLRTHTGEKPYKCQFCEKAFADKSNLRTHEKIHLDIRPFTCDRCGKGFILNRDLLKHMKSHPHVNSQEENQGYHIEQSSLNLGDSDMILSTQINNVLQTLPSYTEL